jgi:hypothetical protein
LQREPSLQSSPVIQGISPWRGTGEIFIEKHVIPPRSNNPGVQNNSHKFRKFLKATMRIIKWWKVVSTLSFKEAIYIT